MKNILLTVFSVMMVLSSAAQDAKPFQLKIVIPKALAHGAETLEMAIAAETEKGETSLGSIMLTLNSNGLIEGVFTCQVEEACCASALWVDDPHLGFSFFIEPGSVTAKAVKDGFQVSGTSFNDALQQYKDETDKLRNIHTIDSINEVYMKRYADTPMYGYLFRCHSAVTYSAFQNTKSDVERIWALGGEKAKRIKSLQNTYNRICHNDLENGQPFRDVEIPDATVEDSRTVHLSDYIGKGKWVFVDFWASWCGGCRQAIPRVKAAYEEVKDKNVMFISIAEWDKRKAALKAMDEEQMPWLQLIDEKGACGEAYMFNAIPRLMLFAPDGTIADKDVDSRKLHEILAKHLGD